MNLRCKVCGNNGKFTAEAQANIHVVINAHGDVINTRPFQQTYKNVTVLKPWKCNSCGAVGKLEDLDTEKDREGENSCQKSS